MTDKNIAELWEQVLRGDFEPDEDVKKLVEDQEKSNTPETEDRIVDITEVLIRSQK